MVTAQYSLDRDGFALLDAAELNRQHPDTFLIPDLQRRQSLVTGDCAKLCFELLADDGSVHGERMWLMVLAAKDSRYLGILESTPVFSRRLRPGESYVEFDANHVADLVIYPANPLHPAYDPVWTEMVEDARRRGGGPTLAWLG